MSVQTSYATAPRAAFAGVLADDSENDLQPAINADSVSIPFGTPVAFKTSSPASDLDVIVPASSGAKFMGIVCHEHDYARTFVEPDGFGGTATVGELDATGLTVGTAMAVLWHGTIWVKVIPAVAVGDRLFVSFAAGSVYTAAGQIGNVTDTNAIDLTNIGRFTSAAAAGKFAKLQVDFSQKP